MAVLLLLLPMMVFLAITGHSNAGYCVCNSGVSDTVLQQNIDYACGAGADCKQISQNGPCYNPNTLKDHCNFAVNSYFQKKGQTPLSCSFQGSATVTSSPPSGASSACFSGSSSTPTNPTTAPPGAGTSTGTGSSTGSSTGTGTGTGTGAGTGTTTGTGAGINVNPTMGGLAPSGATGLNDNSGCVTIRRTTSGSMLLTVLIPGLVWARLIYG